MSVLQDPNLERLLATLHAASDAQTSAVRQHYDERDSAVDRPPEDQAARTKSFLSDKLYALDRDKAEFCYQLCRATDARRSVEIGTSYGVSTLYLAAAVRANQLLQDTADVVFVMQPVLVIGDVGRVDGLDLAAGTELHEALVAEERARSHQY